MISKTWMLTQGCLVERTTTCANEILSDSRKGDKGSQISGMLLQSRVIDGLLLSATEMHSSLADVVR